MGKLPVRGQEREFSPEEPPDREKPPDGDKGRGTQEVRGLSSQLESGNYWTTVQKRRRISSGKESLHPHTEVFLRRHGEDALALAQSLAPAQGMALAERNKSPALAQGGGQGPTSLLGKHKALAEKTNLQLWPRVEVKGHLLFMGSKGLWMREPSLHLWPREGGNMLLCLQYQRYG